jgi:DNA-binding IclR family transcriptional regulator
VSADAPSLTRQARHPRSTGLARPATFAGVDASYQGRVRDRNFIEPLARGLSILQAFRSDDQWLGNLEIASRVGLPNATVNRLLKTLAGLGYLAYSPQFRRYRLAAPVLSLGYAAVANSPSQHLLRRDMQRLADSTNTCVMLGYRDRLDMVLLEICRSNTSFVTLRLEKGDRIPIAETAMGWALLASLPSEERDYLLTHIQQKHEEKWALFEHKIQRGLSHFHRTGYCVSLGAWRSEITTAAVPLVPANRSAALVIACASVSAYMSTSRINREIAPALVSLAERMSTEMPNYDRC